jgi:hypothetical protein
MKSIIISAKFDILGFMVIGVQMAATPEDPHLGGPVM